MTNRAIALLASWMFAVSGSPVRGQAQGQWTLPYDWGFGSSYSEISHGALILVGPKAGHVLLWNGASGESPTEWFFLLNPAVPQNLDVRYQTLASDIFCSCHTWDRDGNLIVCGGHPVGCDPDAVWGAVETYRFDAQTISFVRLQDLHRNRYYPGQVTLRNGDVVVAGCTLSDCVPTTAPVLLTRDRLYTGGIERSVLGSGPWNEYGPLAGPVNPFDATSWNFPGFNWPEAPDTYFRYYPQMFVLAGATERVFVAGDTHIRWQFETYPTFPPHGSGKQYENHSDKSYMLNPTTGVFTEVSVTNPALSRYYSSALIMHTGTGVNRKWNRVLRFGGSRGPTFSSVPTTSVEEWDDAPGAQRWRSKAPLTNARLVQNAVILPDGRILIIGGSGIDGHNNVLGPPPWTNVMQPELYDPGIQSTAPGTSTLLSSAPIGPARVYHSVAMLLPDGRVLACGGSDLIGMSSTSKDTAQIYSPPYLFAGPRPEIKVPNAAGVPPQLVATYGSSFPLQVRWAVEAASAFKVVLIAPGSVTHHTDWGQRYMELDVTSVSQAGPELWNVTATAPLDGSYMPPGMYMLFVLDQGIPSVSITVRLQ